MYETGEAELALRRKLMKLKTALLSTSLIFAASLGAAEPYDTAVQNLIAEGYTRITVERTFFGNYRLEAYGNGQEREVVVGKNGEILRDRVDDDRNDHRGDDRYEDNYNDHDSNDNHHDDDHENDDHDNDRYEDNYDDHDSDDNHHDNDHDDDGDDDYDHDDDDDHDD